MTHKFPPGQSQLGRYARFARSAAASERLTGKIWLEGLGFRVYEVMRVGCRGILKTQASRKAPLKHSDITSQPLYASAVRQGCGL